MKERCEEIVSPQSKQDSHGVHKKIKEVMHSNKNQSVSGISIEIDEIMKEVQELSKIWQNCIGKH